MRLHSACGRAARGILGLAVVLFLSWGALLLGQESPPIGEAGWLEEIRPDGAGRAVPLEPLKLRFEFGWSGIAAGWAEVGLEFPEGFYEVRASGGSTGLARTLWKLDAEYAGRGSLPEFLPVSFTQVEKYAQHRIEIEARFEAGSVRRLRQRIPSPEKALWRSIQLPGLRDLAGVMLFIRSQPLEAGEEIVTLCFPGDAPYLVRIRSKGEESIVWSGESTRAIRLELELQRVGTKGEEKGQLLPHRRFRRASIWLSADAKRLPLRARADLIFGYVYGELLAQSPEEL